MTAMQMASRILLVLVVACSASRGLRAHRAASAKDTKSLSHTHKKQASKGTGVGDSYEYLEAGDSDVADNSDDGQLEAGTADEASSTDAFSGDDMPDSVDSFAQLGRASRRATTREAGNDDDDDNRAGAEDEREDDDEVQEVRQEAQRGPPMDATSLMIQSSNAMLASAKAAAEDQSFAQVGRRLRQGSSQRMHSKGMEAGNDDDDDDRSQAADEREDDDEVQEVRQDAQRGPPLDATSLMLEESNALLASAKAAAKDQSFAQVGRRLQQVGSKRSKNLQDGIGGDEQMEAGESDAVADNDEALEAGSDDRVEHEDGVDELDGDDMPDTIGSFAQLGAKTHEAGLDDEDDERDRSESAADDDEDEVQEVRKDPQHSQMQDATSLMLQESNALLASAKAAAGDA